MTNEQILEAWEMEKQRLAALGHRWSMSDAMRFSIWLAHGWQSSASEASVSAAR